MADSTSSILTNRCQPRGTAELEAYLPEQPNSANSAHVPGYQKMPANPETEAKSSTESLQNLFKLTAAGTVFCRSPNNGSILNIDYRLTPGMLKTRLTAKFGRKALPVGGIGLPFQSYALVQFKTKKLPVFRTKENLSEEG